MISYWSVYERGPIVFARDFQLSESLHQIRRTILPVVSRYVQRAVSRASPPGSTRLLALRRIAQAGAEQAVVQELAVRVDP